MSAVDGIAAPTRHNIANGGYGSLLSQGRRKWKRRSSYFTAEKRLSNEFDETIGWEPATWPFAGGAVAAGVSESEGFSGARAAACLVSEAFGEALGIEASGRGGGSLRLASAFGFAGGEIGCALAVASAVPPRPTLRARLEKNPSDGGFGAADATRVEEAGQAAGAAATNGSSGDPRGGLTVEGMVPGARARATDNPGPSPGSDRPVLPSGSLEANIRFMPPSMPVLMRATGVPREISLAVSVCSSCCFSRTASATSSGTT